ncbi:MAG: cyclic pyranopterin monophosphate synthase MoaC [Pseudomonadota bacterium]|nr:cyclic pyranopterin monophosphate synthase MoaC [Pseudomonadota bacterium]|tara:strand:- start:374 stop:850 length:477 start_codon:yes stop_codon:yes gene_type:complete
MNKKFTHFNRSGEAHMVDIEEKPISQRIAIASGEIKISQEVLEKIKNISHKKGDVLGIARVAGIMATKKTSDLIPLCHNINLTSVEIDFEIKENDLTILCTATVKTEGKTGVEMEALTAVNISLLTIYDMCKSMDRGMIIKNIMLNLKDGGKTGKWER